VKHIDRIAETHGIDGAIGVAMEILDNLQNTRMTKTFERFGL